MIFWTLQITIISVSFIFLIHHLINFFKSTLTIPKIKDLVNSPAQKYENIYKTINSNDSALKKSSQNMKNELKNFLKNQIKTPSPSSESIDSNIFMLDSAS
jgi:hypothetical protein